MSLLEIRSLGHRYPSSRAKRPVLNGVDMTIEEDSITAVVGESGCGKTTLGRVVAGLIEPTTGQVLFDGQNVWEMPKQQRAQYRRAVQVVHQDPFSSLNPGLRAGDSLSAGLLYHKLASRRTVKTRMLELLSSVGLDANEELLERFPHQLSGGQRQRLIIARAMSLQPRLVVADEPVSMLDVSLRVAVLDLLLAMRRQHHLAYVFVSHDFGVVRYFAAGGRILVMFFGVVVEEGATDDVIDHPRHPYTYLLREAIPVPDPRVARARRETPPAERLQAAPASRGCVFANRCPFASDECHDARPPAVEVGDNHRVRCFFPERVPQVSTVLQDRAAKVSVDHAD